MGTPSGPGSSSGRKPSEMPRPEPANVIATIKKVMAELEELMEQRGVEVELARSFEEVQIAGPTAALAETMRNLVWNAIEASPVSGLVRISVHERGGNVVIDVSDDGAGIKPEHLSKIFQPGYTTKQGAAGMGLPTVERRLGELMGSIVWQSPLRHGKGARFTVTLPTFLPSAGPQ